MDGGIYGRFNPQAPIAYGVAIVVQIPFMNTPMHAGPVPKYLDGADLSWVVGLLLTAPLYRKRHSLALSLGHSGVGFTPEFAIQFAMATADGGDIERSDGSFLRLRTHTSGP